MSHRGCLATVENGRLPTSVELAHNPEESREVIHMATSRTGGCLCGAIRYESDGEVMFALRCHCRDCQRQSGAASVAAIRVPTARFHVTKGTPKRFTAKADSGNEIVRAFCGDCGTPIYVQVATRRDVVGLRSARSTIPHGSTPKPIFLSEAHNPGNQLTSRCPNIQVIRLASPIRRRRANDPRRRESPPTIRASHWRFLVGASSNTR